MSNYYHTEVDVLANSPKEIREIAERLENPCIDDSPREVVGFTTEKKIGYQDESVNTARSFYNCSDNWIHPHVLNHLFEVSEAYPTAVFLLECFDLGMEFHCKQVIRQGAIVQEVFDKGQKCQGLEWVLLDIFTPFRVEHSEQLPFESLWSEWVNATLAAAENLKGLLSESVSS